MLPMEVNVSDVARGAKMGLGFMLALGAVLAVLVALPVVFCVGVAGVGDAVKQEADQQDR